MQDALIVLGGYLLGSIPFGYVIPRLVRGDDVRRQGSGNVGASNVWRVYGRSLGHPRRAARRREGVRPGARRPRARRRLGRRARRRGGDGRARPARLPGLLEGRQDGRDRRRRRLRARAASPPSSASRSGLVTFAAFRYASLASMVTAARAAAPLPRVRLLVARSSASRRSPPSACSRSTATTSGRLLAGTEPRSPALCPEASGAPLTGRVPRRCRGGCRSRARRPSARASSGAEPGLERGLAGRRGVAVELARISPTVPHRSATTSWSWIVSRFTWRERTKSSSSSCGLGVEQLLEGDADGILDEARAAGARARRRAARPAA